MTADLARGALCHTSNDHDMGMHMFLRGRSAPPSDAPYLGSIVSRLRPATRGFPSYVWIQELEPQGSLSAQYTSGGHLGVAHAPVSLEDFAATVLAALGVPHESMLAPDDFTRRASAGEPIRDLFG